MGTSPGRPWHGRRCSLYGDKSWLYTSGSGLPLQSEDHRLSVQIHLGFSHCWDKSPGRGNVGEGLFRLTVSELQSWRAGSTYYLEAFITAPVIVGYVTDTHRTREQELRSEAGAGITHKGLLLLSATIQVPTPKGSTTFKTIPQVFTP